MEREKGITQRVLEAIREHERKHHGAQAVRPWMLSTVEVSIYDDDTRPTPGSKKGKAGTVIFNLSDNSLNVSDGTSWRDMAGNVT